MRLDSIVALGALLALVMSACDVRIDVNGDRPERGARAAIDPLPEAGPDTEVWLRNYDVMVIDEPLSVDFELRLRPDRTFRFVAEVEDAGGVERTTVEGHYRWDGDRLTLVDDDGDAHALHHRDGELELDTDWAGDVVFAVTRIPQPALRRAP